MKKHLAIAALVACFAVMCELVGAQVSVAVPEQNFVVKRFGGCPISENVSSLWLTGPDGRPLAMIYFYGPENWYQTAWEVAYSFQDGQPEWVELQSLNARLHIEIYPETSEVAVQSSKFQVRKSNTFLVLHTGQLGVPQEVISLGFFDLPSSADDAPSVLLLQAHQELVKRIAEEGKTEVYSGQFRRPPERPLQPCTPKNINSFFRNGTSSFRTVRFPSAKNREKVLPITYALPCWREPVFSTNVE